MNYKEDLTLQSLSEVCFSVPFNSSNIDVQNTEGNTALHIAAIFDKPECVKLLLRGGANSSLGEFIIYILCILLVLK